MPIRRVLTAAALAFVMAVPSFIQFGLGTLGPFLTDEFALSRSGLGFITGCYYLTAAVMSPLMGRWVGVLGARAATALTISLAVLGTAGMSASTTLVAVLGAVFLGGAASAIANPATNLAISQMPQPHAVLIGVKQSGVQAAALVAGTLLPWIALAAGWRAAFLAGAAVCTAAFVTVPAMPPATSKRPGSRALKTARHAGIARLSTYSALMGAGTATISTYLVLFAHEKIDIPADVAGTLIAVIGVCAMLARIGGAILVERAATAKHAGIAMLRWMAVIGVASTAAIGLAQGIGPASLWAGAVSIGLSAAAFNGVAMLVVVRTAPNGTVARSSGRVQGSFFTGLFLGPPVFGLLVDRSESYSVGWTWTGLCFAAAAIVMSGRQSRTSVSRSS